MTEQKNGRQTAATPLLLLEDETDLATTITDALEMEGYAVLRAASVADAQKQAEAASCPLAILDIRLPDGSGLDALRAIREKQPHCEALIITGFVSLSDAIEAINLGAFSYLQKPVNMDLLLLTLRRAREKQRLTEMLEQRLREVEAQAAMNLRILADRMKLLEEKEVREQEIIRLYRAIQLASRSAGLDEVGQDIIKSIEFSDFTVLHTPDEDGKFSRRFVCFRGMPPFEVRAALGGLTRKVLETKEMAYIADYAADPQANADIVRAGIRSVAGVPLVVGDEIQGILLVNSLKPDAFAKYLDVLCLWAEVVAIAICNSRHVQRLEASRHDLIRLHQAAQLIVRSPRMDQVAQGILKSIDFADYSVLWTVDGEKGLTRRLRHFRSLEPFEVKPGHGSVVTSAAEGEELYVPDAQSDPRVNPDVVAAGVRSILAIPLKVEDELQGVLCLGSMKPDGFADKLEIARLWASMAAVALRNLRHFRAAVRVEREWEAIFDATTSYAVAVLDTDGRIIRANKTAAALLAQPLEQLKGQVFRLLLNGEELPAPVSILPKAIQTKREETVVFPYGDNRRLEAKCCPVVEPDGSIKRVIHVIRDVTGWG